MTKTEIKEILKNIGDSERRDIATTFYINVPDNCFTVRVACGKVYCGTIYCDCILIDDNTELIKFINNNGEIVAIFECLMIDEIGLLF